MMSTCTPWSTRSWGWQGCWITASRSPWSTLAQARASRRASQPASRAAAARTRRMASEMVSIADIALVTSLLLETGDDSGWASDEESGATSPSKKQKREKGEGKGKGGKKGGSKEGKGDKAGGDDGGEAKMEDDEW